MKKLIVDLTSGDGTVEFVGLWTRRDIEVAMGVALRGLPGHIKSIREKLENEGDKEND